MIVVLLGGNTEREISLKSGHCVSAALTELGYEHIMLDPENCNIEEELVRLKPQCVLNMMHGGWGEGGPAQKLLEQLEIPHNGTNSLSAQIFMHKPLAIEYAKKAGLNCPHGQSLTKEEYAQYNHFPHVIKPIDGGSTLGMYKVNTELEKEAVLNNWAEEDQIKENKKLVEEFIEGLEYTLAFFDNKVFGGINIEFPGNMFDYFVKYDANSPAKHTLEYPQYKQAYDHAKEGGLKLYQTLNCSGFVRMDFIIDTKTLIPYFLEANNNPGMTYGSLVPDIAKQIHGMEYTALVKTLAQNTLRKNEN